MSCEIVKRRNATRKPVHCILHTYTLHGAEAEKKGRQKTDNPRKGWEDDGTPPPHRDFKERSVVVPPLAAAHPWASASSEAEALANEVCEFFSSPLFISQPCR